jgi:hypothetical protein
MRDVVAGVLGLLLILGILWDAFEVVVLPRRVTRRVRLARVVIRTSWSLWRALVRGIRARGRREAYLGFFGPLIVIVLLAIWAGALIVGFGMLHWGLGSRLYDPLRRTGFGTDVYMSGTTFFTLGLGDVVPRSGAARVLVVLEAGLGFGFLAMVISYLPVLYQSFSRREVRISLLDAWAGSPPAAGEVLRRLGNECHALLGPFLQEWEEWSAELLETHVSYPVLALFRSQHDNQSWLQALTTVMDVCALVISSADGVPVRQAELTFAMARHSVVDLCQVLDAPPRPPTEDRLPPADLARLQALLRDAGIRLRDDQAAARKLAALRAMYEPYVTSLSRRFLLDLPPWMAPSGARDNWQKSAWR